MHPHRVAKPVNHLSEMKCAPLPRLQLWSVGVLWGPAQAGCSSTSVLINLALQIFVLSGE